MFGPFKKKVNQGCLLGVTADSQGVAAAVIERVPGRMPRLNWTSYQTGGDKADLLKALARERDIRQMVCSSAVQGGEYSVVIVDAPEVPPAELRAAVRWRVNELIDFHVDDAVIDIFDLPSANDTRSNRLYAVAARTPCVRRVVDELGDAGFKLEYIDIPEFALRNLAALLPEDAGGVATVALEATRGLLTVTRQGNLFFSRRLDYGTDRLLADDSDELTPEMEGMLDTLVIEIQRSLDYYERHFSQPAVQTVVLAPCARPLGVAPAYLQSQLGVPVRALNLNEILDPVTPLDAAAQANCLTAIGLALRREEIAF